VPFWNEWSIDQACFTALNVGIVPRVNAGAANPRIPTSLGDVAEFLGVSQYRQLALNYASILGMNISFFPNLGSQRKCPANNGISTSNYYKSLEKRTLEL